MQHGIWEAMVYILLANPDINAHIEDLIKHTEYFLAFTPATADTKA
jgi:hypothetical protein